MIREDQTNQTKDLVALKQSMLVAVPADATLDQVACASALVLSLQALGKQVTFITPQEKQFPDGILGVDQLETQLGNQDLTVSFPYQAEKVDKVSYHIDDAGEKFYLVIKPQKGTSPLDPSLVEYSYTGADADMIFLVGVHTYESLEQLYFGYEALYENVPVVTFHSFEPTIGSIKLDASGSSSLSETMANFLFAIEAPPSVDAASNLLLAIEDATDNFRSLVTTAETFDMVAYLLRQGARRQKKHTSNGIKPLKSSPLQPVPTSSSARPKLPENMTTSKKAKPKTGDLKHQPSGFSPSGGG